MIKSEDHLWDVLRQILRYLAEQTASKYYKEKVNSRQRIHSINYQKCFLVYLKSAAVSGDQFDSISRKADEKYSL